jgi:hypothetical protein
MLLDDGPQRQVGCKTGVTDDAESQAARASADTESAIHCGQPDGTHSHPNYLARVPRRLIDPIPHLRPEAPVGSVRVIRLLDAQRDGHDQRRCIIQPAV